ncbi:MAG: hypothetical protein KKG59_06370 [Nanoarchaeota archaeon]|nr:hypothetical protein [Nanoarchaeota archaeon]
MDKKATPLMIKKLRQISRRLDKAPPHSMVTGYLKNGYQRNMKSSIEDKSYDPKCLKKIIRYIEGMEETEAERGGRPAGRPLSHYL